MCGRYYIADEDSTIELREIIQEAQNNLRYADMASQIKTGEIFPTNVAPVATSDGAIPMKWGFPRWDDKGHIINARSETAFEKNMFRNSLLERRCAIPATGFYEWRLEEGAKKKTKYLFQPSNSAILYMAGCFKIVNDVPVFVILTTEANESIRPFHNRMPVMLQSPTLECWLDTYCDIGSVFKQEEPVLIAEKVK